jgi:hypothetical protein
MPAVGAARTARILLLAALLVVMAVRFTMQCNLVGKQSDRRGFENSIGLHCKMHDVPVVTIIGVLSILAIIAMAAKSSRISFPDQIEAGTTYQP